MGIGTNYGYDYGGSPNFKPPYTTDQIQMYNGAYNPAGVKVDSYTYNYFLRTLYQRLSYFLDYQNIPDTWDLNYVNFSLFFLGYCGVISAKKYGVIPQWGTVGGYGIYAQPTRFTVASKFFDLPNMKIGKDCELLRMTNDYRGIWDTVQFYAVKLALISKAFDMSAINSKVSWAVAAKNKAAAQTIKAMYDKAQAGEPLVVYDNKSLLPNDGENQEPWQFFSRDVHESWICAECLDVMTTIYHQFDTEMGIPNANTQKKERMLTDEVNRNTGETNSRVLGFIENLKVSFERINKLYGTNYGVELRKDGGQDASGNNT